MRQETLTLLSALAFSCSHASPPPSAPSASSPATASATPAIDDVGPTTPETLAPASSDFDIVNLFIDARFVYWAHRGEKGLVKVPLGGGPPITLVPGSEEPLTSLAADANSLYFTTGRHVDIDPTAVQIVQKGTRAGHFEGVVVRLKKDGTAKGEEIASGRFKPEDVAVDATHVYWVNAKRDGTLVRQGLGQVDAQTVVAHGQFLPGSLVVSGGFAYWIDTDEGPGVMRVSTQGGEPQKLSVALPPQGASPGNATHPVRLAADNVAVYVTDAGASEGEGSIVRVAAVGGTVTVVADNLDTPRAVAVHAGWVYWLDRGTSAKNFQDGTLSKAPLAGGPKVTMATGLLAPDRLALSDTRVAWSELNGTIKNIAR
jgi:hypothetical protein